VSEEKVRKSTDRRVKTTSSSLKRHGKGLVADIKTQALKQIEPFEYAAFKEFMSHFYSHFSKENLMRLPEKARVSEILRVWGFFKKRVPEEPKISVTYFKPHRKFTTGRVLIIISVENMSFLLDSLYGILERAGTKPHLTIHPLYKVVRDEKGVVTNIYKPSHIKSEGTLESFIYCEVVENASPKLAKKIEEAIPQVMEDVKLANQDWKAMRAKTLEVAEVLEKLKRDARLDNGMDEIINFVRWIEDEHFTYLGYCNYTLSLLNPEKPFSRVKEESALGIMRNRTYNRLPALFEGITINPSTLKYLFNPYPLFITKTTKVSNVHRNVPMDCIGIRRFDEHGKIIGLQIFVGLFTSVAYDSSARDIPLLRYKTLKIIEKAGLKPEWHDGKALTHILDSLPRDELFQASTLDLTYIGLSILRLQDSPRLAFFVRHEHFNRFLSCIVYIPRERFDSELCNRLGDILSQQFKGDAGVYKAQFGSLPFARVHYTVTAEKPFKKKYDIKRIEKMLINEARSWTDELQQALKDQFDEVKGGEFYSKYAQAFRRSYQERFSTQDAISDILELEATIKKQALSIRVYSPFGKHSPRIKIKIYKPNHPLILSDALPVLENFDLRVISEIPFKVTPKDTDMIVWIHDFELESREHSAINLDVVGLMFA
jgi:glutamate dehydrogenase